MINTDQPEKPTELEGKNHGYCSNCGAPLPPGKLIGVCNDCLEQIGYDPYGYGECEQCGKPLEQDDGPLCKECSQKLDSRYSPKNSSKVKKPTQTYGTSYGELNHAKKHGGAAFIVIAVLVVTISIIASQPALQSANAVGSETSSSFSSTASAAATTSTDVPDVTQTKKADLELLSSDGTFDTSINTIHITGSVKNNSKRTYSYVQIQFVLYDESGSQVGTALANTNGLESGNTWKYDALGMADNVSTFKAIDLSGY